MKSAQQQGEPVAHLWQHSETGRTRVVMPDQIVTADASWQVIGPLYLGAPPAPAAAPAAKREPLTDEQIAAAMTGYGPTGIEFGALRRVARAIERAHGIGGEA